MGLKLIFYLEKITSSNSYNDKSLRRPEGTYLRRLHKTMGHFRAALLSNAPGGTTAFNDDALADRIARRRQMREERMARL